MRVRDLTDAALSAERLELIRAMSERKLAPGESRRWRALNREAERRWPRVTAADFRRVRRLLREVES